MRVKSACQTQGKNHPIIMLNSNYPQGPPMCVASTFSASFFRPSQGLAFAKDPLQCHQNAMIKNIR